MTPEQLLAHFKRAASSLTAWQMATLVAAFVGVVGVVVGSAYWLNTPAYTLLYSDLDPESAGAVTTRLKAANVQYVLDDGGRSIRVSSERIDELRLDLASQGLPTTGRIGFEVFDRTAFGTTDFLKQVLFRRALEGELARTIATMTEVASARVHIALGKDSLFTGDAQQAKASVVLKLRNQRPLAPSAVAGIAGLIAASVESLRPEAVVILDTFGRPLSSRGADDEADLGGAPVERQQRLERELSARVVSLLEPVVGPGHVRVNVSAKLNANSSEETEERWDPAAVIRSRQSTTDTGSSSSVAGVAGARANAPPVAGSPNPPPAAATSTVPLLAGRSTETTNYEVGKVTRHTVAPRGEIARLSVAVILDDVRTTTKDAKGNVQVSNKAREATEVERIKGLVAAAVGLDPGRGDHISVENIAFDEMPSGEDAPNAGWWQQVPPQLTIYLPQVLRTAGLLLLAALAFTMVLRPMVRSAFPHGLLPPGPAVHEVLPAVVRTVADLEGEIEAELDARSAPPSVEARRLPVLTKRIAKKAEAEPEHVARLVRSWLVEEER